MATNFNSAYREAVRSSRKGFWRSSACPGIVGFLFEVQSQRGQLVRGDLARAVVAAGWDLTELRPAGRSLEEIFLQLTGSQPASEVEEVQP